ncbi:hypothetical protein M2387_000927 [Klebsiella sp. BIGb0407]|nr:hypothetical protein [Klebsiella sp. BIGb0407]
MIMFALVIFVCYLHGGCDDFVVEILKTEEQCLAVMDEQRIRRGGCYPLDEVHDSFWLPAQEYADF